MFEQLQAPDHVIAGRFSGKMTGEDIDSYRAILDQKLKKHQQVSVCVDFTELSDLTGDALVKGARADLELLSHIAQFSRCALISDKEWPQAIVRFIAPVLPTLEIRLFPPDQRRQAIEWAAARVEAPTAETPAFRILPTSSDDVFAFEINGVISSEEMPRVIEQFEAFLDRHDKVRLLNRIKHFGGVDPSIFMQGGLVSMKLAAMQKVERYAIVGAPGWMRRIIETMNPVLADIDMRTFPADREEEAWKWLGTKPAT